MSPRWMEQKTVEEMIKVKEIHALTREYMPAQVVVEICKWHPWWGGKYPKRFKHKLIATVVNNLPDIGWQRKFGVHQGWMQSRYIVIHPDTWDTTKHTGKSHRTCAYVWHNPANNSTSSTGNWWNSTLTIGDVGCNRRQKWVLQEIEVLVMTLTETSLGLKRRLHVCMIVSRLRWIESEGMVKWRDDCGDSCLTYMSAWEATN